MKKMFVLIMTIAACCFMVACARETTVVNEIYSVKEDAEVLPVPEAGEKPAAEEETEIASEPVEYDLSAETAEETEEVATVEVEKVEEVAEPEKVETEDPVTESAVEDPYEDIEISDEEWASVLQAFENWKAEQDRIAAGIVEEPCESEDEWEPAPVVEQVTRSEEEVLQFVSNFVANYENTESFRNLEGEGIEYLEDCLRVLGTDPASEPDIASYMEKYRRGSYADEMFQFMLECWIEFGGSFGEGCIIVVQ